MLIGAFVSQMSQADEKESGVKNTPDSVKGQDFVGATRWVAHL
jgi:hypothetical protein